MTALNYSVHVAAAKVAVSDDLPPGEDRRRWSPTASTLIFGERDAVLVDPLMTIGESRALADWVTASGKNVTDIFITHAHGDHFFGAPAVLERYPDARVVATADVAEHIPAQLGPAVVRRLLATPVPGPDRRPTIRRRVARRSATRDRRPATASDRARPHRHRWHQRALRTVHGVWWWRVTRFTATSISTWASPPVTVASGGSTPLTILERLRPGAVVAGHKREGDADDPDLINRTRRYLEDFSAAFDKATHYTELYESMVALYPSRLPEPGEPGRALELGQVRLRLTVPGRQSPVIPHWITEGRLWTLVPPPPPIGPRFMQTPRPNRTPGT
jgi:metallo-beta-lactamase superfamily protein